VTGFYEPDHVLPVTRPAVSKHGKKLKSIDTMASTNTESLTFYQKGCCLLYPCSLTQVLCCNYIEQPNLY